MALTELLPKAIYWAALASLLAMFVGIMIAMVTSGQRWSGLLANVGSRPPDLLRTGYLFGNIALAAAFLIAVLKSGDDPRGLRTATELFNGLDITALTGTASAAYAWSKLRNRDGSRD